MNVFSSLFALAVLLVLLFSACARRQSDPSVKPEMRDAFKTVWKLYSYVWDRTLFEDPKSEKTIVALLNQLSKDFHNIERKAPIEMFEPGFTVTLVSQQQALKDIRQRFESGSKEYAKWRLRSLSQNCISCHSRFNVPADFFGMPPTETDGSFEAEFSSAQFLFATRQFDKAGSELLKLARKVGSVPSGSSYAFRALQLWLVIEVRVKDRYPTAATELEGILGTISFARFEEQAIRTWIADLRKLEKNPAATGIHLPRAKSLLEPVLQSSSIDDDNSHLVKSLAASSIVHTLLLAKQQPDERRQSSYLLAMSYAHMPIQAFDGFTELYLEQCIREFPATKEAEQAFQVYKEEIETGSTGSGGLHLDAEQARKLQELNNLAHGTSKRQPEPEPAPGVF